MITGTVFIQADLEVEVKDENELAEVTRKVIADIRQVSPKITTVEEVDSDLVDEDDSEELD